MDWSEFSKSYKVFAEKCKVVAEYLKSVDPEFAHVDVWTIGSYDLIEGFVLSSNRRLAFDADLLGYSDYELAKYVQASLEGELSGTV